LPLYVNRKTRVRHVNPQCPALRQSESLLDEAWEHDPERRPTARIVEIPDPADPDELEAVHAFTTPCVWCVPGARALWASFPLDFERTYEYDP
jgi:hypothetical protein